jgi:hypothetical protein
MRDGVRMLASARRKSEDLLEGRLGPMLYIAAGLSL